MKEKQDYKAWYYVPVPREPMEMKEQYIQNLGKQGYDAKYTKWWETNTFNHYSQKIYFSFSFTINLQKKQKIYYN